MAKTLEKSVDVPVLLHPSTKEGIEAFLLLSEVVRRGIIKKVEFSPNSNAGLDVPGVTEPRPVLLAGDNRYVGTGAIREYLESLGYRESP